MEWNTSYLLLLRGIYCNHFIFTFLCQEKIEVKIKIFTTKKMEAVTGDAESQPNPNEFPIAHQITPFPEPIDLTTVLKSGNVPPQKLRPIRKSPAEDPPVLLPLQPICAAPGEATAYFDGAAVDLVKLVGSGLDSDWGSLEEDSSSFSEDDDIDDLLANVEEAGKRKRKRETRKEIETFLENLVMRMMEKQEQMHKQLIEMIEKRERERIIREESWKQQEMERMKRDEEIRAQEISRSTALITFIQNALGHELQIPQSFPVSCMEENGVKDGGNHTENIMCNQSDKRWPEAEVQGLIMVRTALEHKFRITGSKCSMWDEISVGMRNMGYNRSAKKCKEKWENINKYFKRSMENGKKHLENSKTCPYFHDLDILYKNGLVSPGNANASNLTSYENVAENEKE